MSSREKLKTFIEVLSDYECKHLLSAVQDIMDGERFWRQTSAICTMNTLRPDTTT